MLVVMLRALFRRLLCIRSSQFGSILIRFAPLQSVSRSNPATCSTITVANHGVMVSHPSLPPRNVRRRSPSAGAARASRRPQDRAIIAIGPQFEVMRPRGSIVSITLSRCYFPQLYRVTVRAFANFPYNLCNAPRPRQELMSVIELAGQGWAAGGKSGSCTCILCRRGRFYVNFNPPFASSCRRIPETTKCVNQRQNCVISVKNTYLIKLEEPAERVNNFVTKIN